MYLDEVCLGIRHGFPNIPFTIREEGIQLLNLSKVRTYARSATSDQESSSLSPSFVVNLKSSLIPGIEQTSYHVSLCDNRVQTNGDKSIMGYSFERPKKYSIKSRSRKKRD